MTVRGKTEWQRLVDEKLRDHDKRLSEQEKAYAVYEALQEEQRKHIDERFNRIQDNVTKTRADLNANVNSIKAGINKVLWAVGLAVALAATQWVLSGGLWVVRP